MTDQPLHHSGPLRFQCANRSRAALDLAALERWVADEILPPPPRPTQGALRAQRRPGPASRYATHLAGEALRRKVIVLPAGLNGAAMTTDASSATGGVCVHLTNAADPSAGRVTAHCPPGLVSNKATGGQILRRVVAAINETLTTITAAPGETGRTGEPGTTPPFWSIDFALLRTQKRWLSSLNEDHPEAEGILALLDSIQDHATDLGGIPEATVFGYELADHDHWESVVDAAAEAFTFDSERAEHVALATDAAGRWTRVIGCYATLARALAGEPEDPETTDTVPVVVTRTPSLDEYTVRVGEAIVARIGRTAQQRAEGL